jgi:peptide-methionine (S)-S-oxide reductase
MNNEIAIFAGGCFWCTEAIFLQLRGVTLAVPGYIGGGIENPTYNQICEGTTGHAEAIKISFDPSQVTYQDLLEVFFATHDPTTLNRQGADVGTQYRSEIFFTNQAQKQQATDCINYLDKIRFFSNPIVTKVSKAVIFYPAEDYHQNYYNRNKNQSYCHYVITPKMSKLKTQFLSKLK